MKKSDFYKSEIKRIDNKIQTNKEQIDREKNGIRESKKYVEYMINENKILEQITKDYADLISQEIN